MVSARKYRPSDFEEVIGQDHITTTLKNAIEHEQLAQAMLFCGPRGVGKTTCARIVARLINGFDKNIVMGPSAALNIYELDAASNNSVDDIRNLIDQVRFPPQYGKYKVYIIDEVHMLSTSAFNAFLKTLEEPPSYAVFILATTEKHKVLPTILSRCQIFDFNRISIQDITDHLYKIAIKEKIEVEPEAIHLISQKSEGALRDALSLFDLLVTYASGNKLTYKLTVENLHILDYDYYFRITDAFINENLAEALLTFDEILKKGFDGQNFILGLAEHFRNLLICKDKETLQLFEITEGLRDRYIRQTQSISNSFLISAINIAHQCDLNFKSSKNQRLHVEIALMKITYLNSALKITETVPTEDGNKKKTENILKKQPGPVEIPEPELVEKLNNGNESVIPALEKIGKKTIDIPKVGDLKGRLTKPEITSNGEETEAFEPEQEIHEFTLEELTKYWKLFLEDIKASGSGREYKLMEKKYSIENGSEIMIEIDNLIEEDILNRFKPELLRFLRTNLKNNGIIISAKLRKSEVATKLYTNTDKFNYLSKKYPALVTLKNKLGLDPEY